MTVFIFNSIVKVLNELFSEECINDIFAIENRWIVTRVACAYIVLICIRMQNMQKGKA